ncbi:MAG: hypothetical protein ACXAC6_18090 [Candidatus Hodarchaeales archaeon]|jgi:hypothetical protein
MEQQCYNEIVELHSFFENWFNAKLDRKEDIFQRFPNVLADEFELIAPSGQKHTRNEILKLVWNAHASRATTGSPMKIWIENFNFKRISDSIFVVTYEEWQKIVEENKGRLSTAIFRKCANNFNGITWLHD